MVKSMLLKGEQIQKQKEELETVLQNQSYKHSDMVKLEQQIEEMRLKLDIHLFAKDQQIGELQKEILSTQMKSTTIKQWIEELKDKFSTEIKLLSDSNVNLQTQCKALQDRLQVLETVEKQLKSTMTEEIEVDGVFVSGSAFTVMMSEVAKAGQNMWEMIQKRLITVMQRPYQMIQIKDQKQEDEDLNTELQTMSIDYGIALGCFQCVQSEGISPNAITYTCTKSDRDDLCPKRSLLECTHCIKCPKGARPGSFELFSADAKQVRLFRCNHQHDARC